MISLNVSKSLKGGIIRLKIMNGVTYKRGRVKEGS
jgi:hypothetical protein